MRVMQAWFLAIRLKTLPAAIVPVTVGGALAYGQGCFSLAPWGLCLAFALLIQVGTNFANDYYDYQKGADGPDRLGPKRAVASGWISPQAMRTATGLVFALALAVGCLLLPYGGLWLLLVGGLSVLCGLAYTGGPYPLGYNGLGDLFVFIFFGWVATVVTFYVQAGQLALDSGAGGWGWPFLAGMVPGALATNLLVVNNVRDAPLDRKVGKRTLVVRLGRRFGIFEYAAMSAIAFGVPLLFAWEYGALIGTLPLLALPMAVATLIRLATAREAVHYETALVRTAALLMVVGALFALSLALIQPMAASG
jgi:1,4-dihydroxy-2-naphthoate octaprenyltransferase